MTIARRSGWGLLYGPFREGGQLGQEMNHGLGRFFREWSWSGWTSEASGGVTALAMLDQSEAVILRVEFPHLGQMDVEVTVNQGVLTIRGERKDEIFRRSLTLPPLLDTGRVSSTFKDGVLEVHLPKTQEAKGRMIEITVGSGTESNRWSR
jgi:HSP20 family protein